MSATQTSSVLVGADRSNNRLGAIGWSWSLWVVRTFRPLPVRPLSPSCRMSRSTRLWLQHCPLGLEELLDLLGQDPIAQFPPALLAPAPGVIAAAGYLQHLAEVLNSVFFA